MALTSERMAVAMSSQFSAGPWLSLLPLEIREMIYGLAIVEKAEHNMKSVEYYEYRGSIIRGLDHTYEFYTSILRTNRAIYQEAVDVFRRVCPLVCLTFRNCNALGAELQKHGFHPLAETSEPLTSPNVAMTLAFRRDPVPESVGSSEEDPIDSKHQNYVVAADDVPAFFTSMLRLNNSKPPYTSYDEVPDKAFSGLLLHITFASFVEDRLEDRVWSPAHRQSKLKALLDSFYRLNGLKDVQISGLRNSKLKEDLINWMAGQRDPRIEMQQSLSASTRGDNARSAGDLSLALSMYKEGLEWARGCFPADNGMPEFWGVESEFWEVDQRSIDDTKVRLQTRIAATYLEAKELRMARIYAERVYGPHHSVSTRYWKEKFPLQVDLDRGPLFAEVLVVAAQISYAQGHVRGALEESFNAMQLDPVNREAQALNKEYQERDDELRQREAAKQEARNRQKEMTENKLRGMIGIALDKASKGADALRKRNFVLARSQFKASIHKMEGVAKTSVGGSCIYAAKLQHVPERYPYEGFILKQRTYLAVTSLRLGDWEDAYHWASSALDTLPDHYIRYWKAWEKQAALGLPEAYYCKALASEKLGFLNKAISSMSKVVELDPGNIFASAHLERLKAVPANWIDSVDGDALLTLGYQSA